jgi:hypothetical protein
VHLRTTALDGEIQPGFIFGSGGLELERHRIVDQFDIDAAIHWDANKNNLGLDFKTNPARGGAKVGFKVA